MEHLESKAKYYQVNSIASSSRLTYLNGQQQYIKFCSKYKLTPYPLHEMSLRLFVTYLAESLSFPTIQSYLAAVRHQNVLLGFDTTAKPMPLLGLLLKGIKRSTTARVTQPRLPVTISVLRSLKMSLTTSLYPAVDKLMLWSAFTTAFFGFLHSAEFCAPKVSYFDPAITLLRSDIKILPDVVLLTLKGSKTDIFRNGVTIRLARSGSSVCPYTALHSFISNSPDISGPLFRFMDGTFLTRQILTSIINQLLQATVYKDAHFTSHCFRIGAATSAAARNLPDWLIKVLGRWSSDSYQTYIRTPIDIVDQVPSKLVG